MKDQVIWARAIVPFWVYDRSYILTFCLLFPPITERPCGVKIAPRPEKNPPQKVVSQILFYCRVFFFSLFFSENQNNCVTL